eukprot:9447-Heterococcus_DN1.PRE.3
MTTAAQQALRRTMEIFSHTTRFALACNNSTKIIEPIQSRCAILRFSRLSDEEVLARLQKVCEAEKVSYTPDGLAAIIFTAEGDMRNALNNLQSTHSGFKHVSQETVFKVCDQPHPAVVLDILQACVQSDIYSAQKLMKALYDTGYSTSDIIGTVFKVCTYQLQVPEAAQLELIKEIGFTHMRIADGVNSLLQLLGLCARLCKRSTELNLGSAKRNAFTVYIYVLHRIWRAAVCADFAAELLVDILLFVLPLVVSLECTPQLFDLVSVKADIEIKHFDIAEQHAYILQKMKKSTSMHELVDTWPTAPTVCQLTLRTAAALLCSDQNDGPANSKEYCTYRQGSCRSSHESR